MQSGTKKSRLYPIDPEGENDMLIWLQANLGTLIVLLVLAGIVAAVIAYLIREKRSGRSACGGSCQGCAMHGTCHRSGKSD